MQDNRKLLGKKDTITIVLIAAAAAAGLIVPELFPDESGRAVISCGGKTIAEVPLGTDGTYSYSQLEGMVFMVENGAVRVTESDCGDMTCMRTGEISRHGEAIVCVPNRAAVKIESDSSDINDLDVILR